MSARDIVFEGISERGSARFGTPRSRRRAAATQPKKAVSGQSLPSRGYQKLASAAHAFNFDFKNKTVLDIGSSTGGFTQYALDHGAKKVIAVEKGTNQMMKPLRFDPRINLYEKTDIFDFRITETSSGEHDVGTRKSCSPDSSNREVSERPKEEASVILADVSFISLTKVLKYAKINLSRNDTQFLVMLKPQFEARPDQLNNGVVKNEKIRRQIIKDFELWLKNNQFVTIKKRDNTLTGKTGNRERFYWLKTAK